MTKISHADFLYVFHKTGIFDIVQFLNTTYLGISFGIDYHGSLYFPCLHYALRSWDVRGLLLPGDFEYLPGNIRRAKRAAQNFATGNLSGLNSDIKGKLPRCSAV